MTIEKSKAIKLTAIVLAVLTIFAAIFTAIYFVRQDAPIADNTLNVENENGFDNTKTYAMPKTMAFTAKSLAAAQANGQTVDVKIKASVSPWDAANQAVDYFIDFVNADSEWASGKTVTDYVTVTQDADGSLTATISCKKAFDSDKIIVTVTTRDGGYTAKCTVSFVGVANSIVINNSTLNPISDSKRGVYYQLGTNKTYNFDIALDNIFGKVGSQNLTVTLGGSGELYFGDEFVSGDSGMGSFSNMAKRKMSDMVNKFITSATISGNTLTLKTGSTVIENYYDEMVNDTEYYTGTTYKGRYVFYDEYDLTGGKDYEIQREANVSGSPSCYFTVTVKDTVSGVSETIKVWLVTSVKSVSLDKTNVSI